MVRINTLLSEDLIKKLDTIAKNEHKSRSSLLRIAAEKLIKEYQERIEEQRRKERIQTAMAVQDRLRKKSGKWDGVAELRKWRETSK